MAITTEDIKALRYAGQRFGKITAHTEDGKGRLRVHHETSKRNSAGEHVWTVQEQELFPENGSFARSRTIETEKVRITHHGPSTQGRGYASVWRTEIVATLANILRPGDELHLDWQANNDSDMLREHGWVRDECWLHVMRKGKHYATMQLDEYVGPDNTARLLPR